MSVLQDLVTYYVDRLIVQFRTLPKARDTVAITVKQAIADDLPIQLNEAFNVDTAVGAQLDIIGKYVGVPRQLGSAVARGYFGLWTYASALDLTKYQGVWDPNTNDPPLPAPAGPNTGDWYVANDNANTGALCGWPKVSDGAAWNDDPLDNGNGLNSYAELSSNRNAPFYSYSTATRSATDLTDPEYRTVIKLRIMQNSNDGTLKTIVEMLQLFFPGMIAVVDNRNMTMDYYVNTLVPLSKEILQAYLPRPMGVGITIIFVSPTPGGGDHLTTESGDTLTTEDGSGLISTETP